MSKRKRVEGRGHHKEERMEKGGVQGRAQKQEGRGEEKLWDQKRAATGRGKSREMWGVEGRRRRTTEGRVERDRGLREASKERGAEEG